VRYHRLANEDLIWPGGVDAAALPVHCAAAPGPRVLPIASPAR